MQGNLKLKPLVKWSGGKGREIECFCHHYPDSFDIYIEPFVGGGSVFFDLNFEKNVIADVHKELINFYQQIKEDKALEIYEKVSKLKIDETTYYFVRDEMCIETQVDVAVRFYYLRKTAFRGMLRYNKSGKFNIPWGRYKNANFELIKDFGYVELLKRTDIRLASFEEIFNKYNDENNFVFLDPPYDTVFKNYGYCQFGPEYQEKLAAIFKTTKNKCLMIIGDSELIRDLYSGYIVDSYFKKYVFKIHSGRIGKDSGNQHLIIKNYH